MEFEEALMGIFLIGFFILAVSVLIATTQVTDNAELVCQSHGLEMIDYERELFKLTKVECGNKKPELQYDNYKVFTK